MLTRRARSLTVFDSYIKERLTNNDFEIEGGEETMKREEAPETQSLYPALPQQVEASG